MDIYLHKSISFIIYTKNIFSDLPNYLFTSNRPPPSSPTTSYFSTTFRRCKCLQAPGRIILLRNRTLVPFCASRGVHCGVFRHFREYVSFFFLSYSLPYLFTFTRNLDVHCSMAPLFEFTASSLNHLLITFIAILIY